MIIWLIGLTTDGNLSWNITGVEAFFAQSLFTLSKRARLRMSNRYYRYRAKVFRYHSLLESGLIIDGVSPSVFRCTSTPMETGPIDACVET